MRTHLHKFLSFLVASTLMLNLLTSCFPQPMPAPAATATVTPSPDPTSTPTPPPTATDEPPALTWDGSADLSLWQGGTDYILEAGENELHVWANKITPTAYMEAFFPALDITQAPYASLSALSDVSANITVGLVDAAGKEGWLLGNAANREMAHGSHPMIHSFDFSRLSIDLTQVTAMRIAFNRNAPVCKVNAVLSDILLGGGAVRALSYAPLPNVEVTLGDKPLPITLYPLTEDDAGAAWSAEFPAEIIKTGEFIDGYFTYTLTGQPGSGVVTLTGVKDGKSIRLAFDLSVAVNQPPILESIAGQVLAVDTVTELRLTGLNDGDPASAQALTLTAESQNTAIATVEEITFDGVSRWATLTIKAAAAGKAPITLTLRDDRGLSASQTFEVAAYPEINQIPTFDAPAPMVIDTGSEARLEISGVSGGEASQQVTLTAQSDTPDVMASMDGSTLIIQAAAGFVGSAVVEITATDNGGNERNQGHAALIRSLPVTVIQPAITGLSDPFDGPSVDPNLAGSGEGAHTLTIEENTLRVDVDKYTTNNNWAGLWYALPTELDLSANPVITLRMKANKETAMLIFLWDATDIYNTAETVTVLVGTEWQDYVFDFTGKNLSSEGKTLDFSRIKALLINFAPGLPYKGTFWLDDLKVGSEAAVQAAAAPLKIQTPLQLTLLPGGSITERFSVSGLAEGDQVELSDVDPAFISSAELILEGNDLLLNLSAVPGAVGFTRVTIRVTGQGDRKAEKPLDIIFPQAGATAQVVVDRSIRYQILDGFGAFLGTGVFDQRRQDLTLPFVQDLGMTIARFGIIDNDFEHQNDNANPYVTDFNAFDTAALPLEWMKRLKAETAIDKYILTIWSPPAWMKKNRTQAASAISGDNFIEERYYEEYAEFLVSIVRVVKEHTDIDLYAISVQNEPQFNEPYASALLPANKMAQLLKIVTTRFAAEGLQTKFYMPEALPQQQGIEEYIRQLDLVPEASQKVDIIAIHNYDSDGINVGGAGAQEWLALYGWANAARPRQVWMSETSGHPDNWTGAEVLFGNIYNAVVYGNASAWVWWTLAETSHNAEFGLVVDSQASSRYAVSRHFYRAAQPGAVRVATTVEDDLLSVAFENPDGTLTVVLYNKGKTRLVSCIGAGTLLDAWVSVDGLLSRPAQQDGESVLLPADGVATLVYRPQP